MTLQSNTSFNHHIDGTVTKAKQTFLRRKLKICSTKTNDQAYKSLVRLVLEYTSMLAQSGTLPPRRTSGLKWYSYRQVTWFVLSTSSVDKMLQHFYWPTLTQCCKLACLSVMYKVTNQLTLSSHLSLNREGRLVTTDDFTTIFLHFLCSPLPSWTWRTPDLSITSILTSNLFFCLSCLLPPSLCLARWIWPDPMNWRHVHTTAFCVSLRG